MVAKRTESKAEVAIQKTEIDWSQITTTAQAMEALGATSETVADVADEIGDGFSIVKDKSTLIDVPLLLIDHEFQKSDIGENGIFSVFRFMTRDDRKLIVTDGSTGMHAQMVALRDKAHEEGRQVRFPMVCHFGLRRSDYTNEHGAGTTFYINTNKKL